jgi:hypothetical protein
MTSSFSLRVDRLIIDHLREHARVKTLLEKMRALRNCTALPPHVHEARAKWMEAIQNVQAKRKDEIMNAAAEAATAIIASNTKAMHAHRGFNHGAIAVAAATAAAVNGVVRGVEDKG